MEAQKESCPYDDRQAVCGFVVACDNQRNQADDLLPPVSVFQRHFTIEAARGQTRGRMLLGPLTRYFGGAGGSLAPYGKFGMRNLRMGLRNPGGRRSAAHGNCNVCFLDLDESRWYLSHKRSRPCPNVPAARPHILLDRRKEVSYTMRLVFLVMGKATLDGER